MHANLAFNQGESGEKHFLQVCGLSKHATFELSLQAVVWGQNECMHGRSTGSAAGMESLEKVWNLFFQFPDLEKVWKFVKSFGNFKKRFGTFCLLPEKNFEDRKCASRSGARKLLPRV